MFISSNPKLIDDASLNQYLRHCEVTSQWKLHKCESVWNERVIHHSVLPKHIKRKNMALLGTIKRLIFSEFKITRGLYADYFGLVRWRVGDFQDPHADSENPDGSQHQYYWRAISSVFYLNDNYQGGTIYFPNQNIEIKPERNTLLIFPGTLQYLHAVRKITSGVRYTVTAFWTYDKNRSMF